LTWINRATRGTGGAAPRLAEVPPCRSALLLHARAAAAGRVGGAGLRDHRPASTMPWATRWWRAWRSWSWRGSWTAELGA